MLSIKSNESHFPQPIFISINLLKFVRNYFKIKCPISVAMNDFFSHWLIQYDEFATIPASYSNYFSDQDEAQEKAQDEVPTF